MRIGVKPGQWGWSWRELTEAWKAADEAGFALISCFDHLTASPTGRASWDAASLAIAMASYTTTAHLSVDVLNTAIRSPFLTAAQMAVAQAASNGRVEVGLGAGSRHLARFDHHALGAPFPSHANRLMRLEAFCSVLPKLWTGQSVTDAQLNLAEASLGPIDITPPPLVIGGASDAVLELAARYADGWNCSVRDGVTFVDASRRLDSLCKMVRRDRPIRRGAQVFLRDIPPDSLSDVAHEYEQAGVDDLVLVLVDERDVKTIHRLASDLL